MSIAGIFVSVVVRGLGSGIQFLSFMLVAHLLMPEQFGIFQVSFSIICFLAVLSKFGLESKLMARIGGEIGKSKRTFTEYEQIVLMIVVLIACAISFLYRKIVEQNWQLLDGDAYTVSANYSLLTVLLATISIVASILRATGKPNKSNLVELLIPYGLFVVCLAVTSVKSVENILILLFFSFLMSLSFSILGLCKLNREKLDFIADKLREIAFGSLNLYVVEILNFIMLWSPIILLYGFRDSYAVGIYAFAFRIAQIFNIVIIGANAKAVSSIAKCTASFDFVGAARVSRAISLVSMLVLIPIYFAVLILGKPLLGMFFSEYQGAFNVLIVLATSQLINAYTASSQMIIIFSGLDNAIRNIIVISSVCSLLVSYILIPVYGELGAAIGAAFGIVMQNFVSVWVCRIRLKCLPVYMPFKLA